LNIRGFTLVDLLIVIVILGIMGMLILPDFHSTGTIMKLDNATGELVSALEYAQNLAVRHQRPFGVKAEVAGNWFRVFDSRYKDDSNPHHDEDPPADAYGVILNPVDKSWYIMDYDTQGVYDGVHILSVPAGGEVTFYPDGHSSSVDSTFTLSLGSNQKTITIDGGTGRITVL